MAIESPKDLFKHKLHIIYHIENHLADKLTEMADKAANKELSEEFNSHQSETSNQIKRLENVFEETDMETGEIETAAMHGLFEDVEQFEDQTDHHDILDLYYKAGAMKIEHMEISIYENLISLTDKMDVSEEIVEELQDNLNEEQEALESLKKIEIET